MKTVVHVITDLDIGGAEKQLALILPNLRRDFNQHVIYLRGRGLLGDVLRQQGIPVHYLGSHSRFSVYTSFRLYRQLRILRPDITIGYLLEADLLNRITSRLVGVPFVISSQRSSFVGHERYRLLDKFTRFLISHYVVQTQISKKELAKRFNWPAEKITVIPNAVDTRVEGVQAATGPRGKLKIICVANLKPGKGHDRLLQAFEQIFPDYPQTELLLVGNGELRRPLEQQVVNYRSRNSIKFLGTRHDVAALLGTSDIFVLPTEGEGMSNALLEAMATGLPCVSTDIPVNRDLITHQSTGLLYQASRKQDLIMALRQLITTSHLRQRLGQAARNHVRQRHAVPIVSNQWLTLLSQLL